MFGGARARWQGTSLAHLSAHRESHPFNRPRALNPIALPRRYRVTLQVTRAPDSRVPVSRYVTCP
jgi:hypothetical protein